MAIFTARCCAERNYAMMSPSVYPPVCYVHVPGSYSFA